ncbi:VOC family protein [Paenibacillaceae bacterium]|nr:VOC family protein [Paenibacillaceae bacterium]
MQANNEVSPEKELEQITGITCIYIPVSNVYESLKWYQKNLGCQPTNHNPIKPDMEIAILGFPDHNGNFSEAGLRCTVPALFLITAKQAAGSYGFTYDNGTKQAVFCFITPRIQEMYERFKENGVKIEGEIRQTCGPNLQFYDPDGNMLEVWQP